MRSRLVLLASRLACATVRKAPVKCVAMHDEDSHWSPRDERTAVNSAGRRPAGDAPEGAQAAVGDALTAEEVAMDRVAKSTRRGEPR